MRQLSVISGKSQSPRRSGAVVPFLAILIVPLLGIVAFSIDYGYLTVVRADMQRTADAAALAASLDLIPADDGTQDLAAVRARVREYVTMNLGVTGSDMSSAFTVRDEDIVVGDYDPDTIYSGSVSILSTPNKVKDTVRVTLRRDALANSPVNLMFARVLGNNSQSIEVTATAVLRRGSSVRAGVDVLPFAVHEDVWDPLPVNQDFSIYADNKVRDNEGNELPGNWGTVDIGLENNSTSDLSNQILDGLRQSDVDNLYNNGRIPDNTEVPVPVYFQGDPGLSVGLKHAVQAIHGQIRYIPIYDSAVDNGNNSEFHVVKWGVVRVIDSRWQGSKFTYVRSHKAYTYGGPLIPMQDLSNPGGSPIEGGFTSPVLVQ